MTKYKLVLELPTESELTAGADLATVHPKLPRAEAAFVEAEQALASVRAETRRMEAELPILAEKIHRGEAPASALEPARRALDVQALKIRPYEQALANARGKVAAETQAARKALEAEVAKRARQLEKIAAELAPILEKLTDLDFALARILDPQAMTTGAEIVWPQCMRDYIATTNADMTARANMVELSSQLKAAGAR